MRTPKQAVAVAVAKPTLEHRIPSVSTPTPQKPVLQPAPVDPKPAAPAATAASAPAIAPTASEAPSQPAVNPAPSGSVAVETDSMDRVSVLVKSRPTGARVYRRGKEIGRTPLTIQIGRGEHRIFEVGWTSTGTRRISVDGEKAEIAVILGGESKPKPTTPIP
jgi:hypothetical protein